VSEYDERPSDASQSLTDVEVSVSGIARATDDVVYTQTRETQQ